MSATAVATLAERLNHASSVANGRAPSLTGWIKGGAIITLTTKPLKESPSTPAWYDPKTGDININVAIPFDLESEKWRVAIRDFRGGEITGDAGLIWGLIAHEAAHSAWTSWVPADLDRSLDNRVIGAMVLFEEIRIEKRAVDRGRTSAASMLRKSFAWLLGELIKGDVGSDPFSVAHTWALTYGRYLGGIAALSEIEAVDSLARTALGDDTVDIMREILGEACGRCDLTHLTALGQEWVDLLQPLAPEQEEGEGMTVIIHGPGGAGEGSGKPFPGKGEGEEGDGEGEGQGGQGSSDEKQAPGPGGGVGYSETDPELAAVLGDALKAIEASMQTYTEPPQPESPLADPQELAARVFGKQRERAGYSWSKEAPSAELRAHALRLARTLEALSLPSVTLTHKAATLPPGRLRGREMVRQGAERSRGMMSTATPWSQTKRRHTSTKPVIVGVATDTSGSMSYATRFVAEFAWLMGTAGQRIGARTAAVTFGEQAEAITRPGEVPNQVVIRQANGGHENFNHACAALEGVLHYTAAVGAAKILFVVSDGMFVLEGEMLRAQKWLRNLTKAGTLVVWLGVQDDARAKSLTKMVADKSLVHFTTPGMKDPDKMIAAMEATVIKAARSM